MFWVVQLEIPWGLVVTSKTIRGLVLMSLESPVNGVVQSFICICAAKKIWWDGWMKFVFCCILYKSHTISRILTRKNALVLSSIVPCFPTVQSKLKQVKCMLVVWKWNVRIRRGYWENLDSDFTCIAELGCESVIANSRLKPYWNPRVPSAFHVNTEKQNVPYTWSIYTDEALAYGCGCHLASLCLTFFISWGKCSAGCFNSGLFRKHFGLHKFKSINFWNTSLLLSGEHCWALSIQVLVRMQIFQS